MNVAQNSKYWRRWAAVSRHNHWQMSKGRLAENAVREASQFHEGVWNLAENIAAQAVRAVTADDLRHGCHVVALGRDISHGDMTNEQFNRLLVLWGDERKLPGLLIYPDHIRSVTYWTNPELQRRESLIWQIKDAAPDAYITAITSQVWGTIYWEDLDAKALMGLLRKLKGRQPVRQ